MNTTENNKLIAEFIGYSQPHPNYPTTTYWYKEGKEPLAVLLFDTDWNWLMEVVEKIYNTIENITDEQELEWDTLTRDLRDNFYFPKIEAVYNACVKFIKWYNNGRV